MPKGTIEFKKGDRRFRVKSRTKFKLGNRKSTTSALALSTVALCDRFVDGKGSKKDLAVVRQVLDARGFDLATYMQNLENERLAAESLAAHEAAEAESE